MIKHTVFFRLKHPHGSDAEARFIELAHTLTRIPGVNDFECVRQVGKKCEFDWGLLMAFDDQGAYDAYNSHPDHQAFVAEHWMSEVEEFLEIDYVPYR
ncbi:Dabb family protein [Variovorax sp. J22R133]|uniref:Dabb family protein n=1 Tax=Variovorax brevis TaxID=3053503 RepID=UPI002577087A|nr:Dabb family protein [Variovorax sp. J22R133]MDM0111887.1 Dabb family protein [Variovorax sp. J22R133]